MRVPFPLDLSIGTDIVAIRRFFDPSKPDTARLTRLAHRFLLTSELQTLQKRFPFWLQLDREPPSQQRKVATWLGGRWAAKEAAKKAWDASLIGFKDLKVQTTTSSDSTNQRVQIVCSPFNNSPNLEQTTSPSPIVEQSAQLSISHDGEYAIATVIATPLHHLISAELALRKSEAERKVGR